MGFHIVIFIIQNCIPVYNKKIISCIDTDFGIIKSYLLSTYIYKLELLIIKCVHKLNCCKDNRFRNWNWQISAKGKGEVVLVHDMNVCERAEV
jgi:hypothetical protein